MKLALHFVLIIFLFTASSSFCQEEQFRVSPKKPWADISELPSENSGKESSTLSKILLYLPNRVMDFLDIFKVDLGVGPAAGGIVRLTEHGQVGARVMLPASLRVGLMGRRAPFMLEHESEYAFGESDSQRQVCKSEIGAGLDLLLISAYLGFCPDELIDFAGGLFMLDNKHDDF